MRRLDEWHKYVDLQSRRASAAKTAPAALPGVAMEEESDLGRDQIDGFSESIAQNLYEDHCVEVDEPAVESLPDESEPAYMRPTPLPPQIEFASRGSEKPLLAAGSSSGSEKPLLADGSPADLPTWDRLREADSQRCVPAAAQTSIGLRHAALYDGHRVVRPAHKAMPPVRIPRGGRPSAADRKETREELLARLLDPELTLEEAAQVLNVCPTTVRRYTNRGILPHYRTMGNQRRFRLSQVLAFLESQEAQPRPSPAKADLREQEPEGVQQFMLEEETPAQL